MCTQCSVSFSLLILIIFTSIYEFLLKTSLNFTTVHMFFILINAAPQAKQLLKHVHKACNYRSKANDQRIFRPATNQERDRVL